MTHNEIKSILTRLEKLMYGYNYQVTLGFDALDECSTLDECTSRIEQLHKDFLQGSTILVEQCQFWDEINLGLNFRSDNASGLRLTKGKKMFYVVSKVNIEA